MKQIGKFQLIRTLGKGASATVYLALDTYSGKEVALKVLAVLPTPSATSSVTSSVKAVAASAAVAVALRSTVAATSPMQWRSR